MKNRKLDLETLKYIKVHFDLFSDMSTKCMGYGFICSTIERIEEVKESKPTENDTELAEILMQELSEHRT